MKKKNIFKPYCFYQELDIYRCGISVFVGLKDKDMALRLVNSIPTATDQDIRNIERMDEAVFQSPGCFCHYDSNYFLFLQKPKNWEMWEEMMHECHHAIFIILGRERAPDEIEAQAYAFQYLFRSIRRKIQGKEPHNGWILKK